MVRAMESFGVTATGSDFSAAMRADVGERVNSTLAVTTDYHWLVSNSESQIIARVRYFFFPAQANPMLHEDGFLFQIVDFRGGVHEAGLMMGIGTKWCGVAPEILLQLFHK